MTTELIPPARASTVRSGRHALIAGLQWQWVPARGQRLMRNEARDQLASHWVALPAGTADEPATWLGLLADDAPELPKGPRPASLSASLSGCVPEDCWGAFLLPDGRWWFMAFTGGLPSPYGDVTGDAAAVIQAADRFRSTAPPPATGWVVFDPDRLFGLPDTREDALGSLLPAVIPARAMLKKTDTRTGAILLLTVLVLGGAAWWGSHWIDAKKKAEHDARVRSALMQARAAAVAKPASLIRPWGNQPDFPSTLSACVRQWRQAPISVAGWVFRQAVCESSGQLTLHYALPDGGTVGDFAARLPEIYGPEVRATFNMPGPSDDASFRQQVHFSAPEAEALLPGDEQLRRLTSYAQRLRANLRITSPQGLTQSVGQEDVPLPWHRYGFTFITDIPPDRLFDASRFPGNGLRLSSVRAELHSSRLTYTLEGVLYAEN